MSTDLIQIVRELNDEIYDETGESDFQEWFRLNVLTTGYNTCVEFVGIMIWNDVDDERNYNEETDEMEPIKTYLRRRIKQLVEDMGKLTGLEENVSRFKGIGGSIIKLEVIDEGIELTVRGDTR